MSYEVIEHDGVRFAEVIWAGTTVEKTKFFSPADSSLQFGLLAHGAGFVEAAHYHHSARREIRDMQQMLVVQRGAIQIRFHDKHGDVFREIVVRTGDAVNLIHGTHSLRVLEDMQCVSVKQGPFLGDQLDKVPVDTK